MTLTKPLRNPAYILADLCGIPADDPSVKRMAAYCDAPPTKAEFRKAGVYSKTALPPGKRRA